MEAGLYIANRKLGEYIRKYHNETKVREMF